VIAARSRELAGQHVRPDEGEARALAGHRRGAVGGVADEHDPPARPVGHGAAGNALGNLGERESGTARLEEAVTAFRAALKERTRERVPLDWATTQNNLGTALWNLGEREIGTARLEEAVTAFRAALKEYTRERVPLQWATTQNNLGLRSRP
jgi:tetratricopeptide (TPR) repeat protein